MTESTEIEGIQGKTQTGRDTHPRSRDRGRPESSCRQTQRGLSTKLAKVNEETGNGATLGTQTNPRHVPVPALRNPAAPCFTWNIASESAPLDDVCPRHQVPPHVPRGTCLLVKWGPTSGGRFRAWLGSPKRRQPSGLRNPLAPDREAPTFRRPRGIYDKPRAPRAQARRRSKATFPLA